MKRSLTMVALTASLLLGLGRSVCAAQGQAEPRLAVTGYSDEAYNDTFRTRLSDFLAADPPIKNRGIGILVTWYVDNQGRVSRNGQGSGGGESDKVSTPDYGSVAAVMKIISDRQDLPGLLLYLDPEGDARSGRDKLKRVDFPAWTEEILALARVIKAAGAPGPKFVLLAPELSGVEAEDLYQDAWRSLVGRIKEAWGRDVLVGYCFKEDSPSLTGTIPPWLKTVDELGATCMTGGDSYLELLYGQAATVERAKKAAAKAGKKALVGEWGFPSSATAMKSPYSSLGFHQTLTKGKTATDQDILYSRLLPRMADEDLLLSFWRFSSYLPGGAEYAPSDVGSKAGRIVRALLAENKRIALLDNDVYKEAYVPPDIPLKWIPNEDGSAYSLNAPIRITTADYQGGARGSVGVFCDLDVEHVPGTKDIIYRSMEGAIPHIEIEGDPDGKPVSIGVKVSGFFHRSQELKVTRAAMLTVCAEEVTSGVWKDIHGAQEIIPIPPGDSFDIPLEKDIPLSVAGKCRLSFVLWPGDSLATAFRLRVSVERAAPEPK